MSNSAKIFFFSTLWTPFIEEDYRLLAKHFPIRKRIASGLKALLTIPAGVARADITLVWFGSVYAGYAVFFSRLFRKRSIVIVAGIDASKDAEINYGIWLSPWKSLFVRHAFRHADRLLPVDPFLEKEARRLAEYDGANISTVAFGFDPTQWTAGTKKANIVLCVAACHDEDRMRKKGIDKLLDAARRIPDVPFRLIGIARHLVNAVKKSAPPNVEIIPYVARGELLRHYQESKVYCQPSYTEGLPNTLCEAMLCGCIPVGTIAGGIPTAIGDAGFLVPLRDQDALVDALHRALNLPSGEGAKARQRMVTEFSLGKREQALLDVIHGLGQ